MYYLCFNPKEELSFSSAGRFVTSDTHPHPERTLDSAVLLFGYSGKCPVAQEGREYILEKGAFQLLFPFKTHYGTAPTTADESHFWCHFYLPNGYKIVDDSGIEQMKQKGMCIIPEFSYVDDCEKYFVLFSQLIDEAEIMIECNKLNSIICDSYLKILLCSLSENCNLFKSVMGKKRVCAHKILEWLRLNACKGITVHDAANSLNYNADYLTQIVKSETGMPLCEYINSLRLKHAKNLLLNSDMRVSQIAFAVGFSDEKYFMKVFRKFENVTPSQYRKAYFRTHINNK